MDTDGRCVECSGPNLVGTVCDGGPVKIAPGYYARGQFDTLPYRFTLEVMACGSMQGCVGGTLCADVETACTGGPCGVENSGERCGSCKNGYFLSEGGCSACSDLTDRYLGMIGIILLCFPFCWMSAEMMRSAGGNEALDHHDSMKISPYLGLGFVVYQCFQVIALCAGLRSSWWQSSHSALHWFLDLCRATIFDWRILHAECAWTSYERWELQQLLWMLSGLLYSTMTYVTWCGLRAFGKRYPMSAVNQFNLMWLWVSFPSICKGFLSCLECYALSEVSTRAVWSSPEVECFSEGWWRTTVASGILFSIYAVTLLVCFAMLPFVVGKSEISVRNLLRGLLPPLLWVRSEKWWWTLVIALRGVLLGGLCAVFPDDESAQSFGALVILTCSYGMHIVHWPYDPPSLNQMEAYCLPGMMWAFVLHLHSPGGMLATLFPIGSCAIGIVYGVLAIRYRPTEADEFANLVAKLSDRPWTFLESEQAMTALTEATERSLGSAAVVPIEQEDKPFNRGDLALASMWRPAIADDQGSSQNGSVAPAPIARIVPQALPDS
jgi:hypothetical protein